MNPQTPQRAAPHDLEARPAENGVVDASGANFHLPWRRLGRFFAAVLLAGFILNEIWEMALMSFYVETAGQPWMNSLGVCTRAAAGDVGIILAIYAAGALATGDSGWGLRGRWNLYAATAVLGLAAAALAEHAALAAGRWTYADRMPMLPLLGAGLWPLLQMTLLAPLTFWLAYRWAGRGARQVSS